MLHLPPYIANVTGLTWEIPKWGLGTAVDKLKHSSGMVVTNQMKRGIVLYSTENLKLYT